MKIQFTSKKFFSALFVASVVAATSLLSIQEVMAHSGHTPNVCSAVNSRLCAHLGFENEPNSTDEWAFMLHFMLEPGMDPRGISDVSVKLWMNMGSHSHGSSPVSLNQKDDVHFEVTEGYFPMAGPWEVKVAFKYEGNQHEIIIPIVVK